MGTDAHGVIQRKTDAHGFITVLSLDYVERHYALFDLLAGARAGQPLIEPRGLPKDGWDRDEIEEESSGDHSKTWLTVDELKAVRDALGNCSPSPSVDLSAWIAVMEGYSGETRIVLWFDN